MTDTARITDPRTWDEVEVNLAATLEGYQARIQQQLLARSIEDSLGRKSGPLMAQAGCGTGKSLGGMVPMLLDSVNNGKRAIVATATKALQEQYATSDVPFLQENSGIDFTWALLKGRTNYLCRAKMVGEEAARIEVLEALKAEIEAVEEHSGDREHFATPIEDMDWMKLSTSSNECPGRSECPFGEVCFAEIAKSNARKADLVITNTAMAMTDAVLRQKTQHSEVPFELLGPYDTILFDEAHEIPEYASNALGYDFTASRLGTFATRAVTFAALQGNDIAELGANLGEIVLSLDGLLIPIGGKSVNLAWFAENGELFMDLRDAVIAIRTSVMNTRVSRDKEPQEAKRKMLMKQGQGIIDELVDMVMAPDDEQVRWVETYTTKRGGTTWKLRTSPVDIAPFLDEMFWSEKDAVLMSATLSAGKTRDGRSDFTYLQRTMGLDGAATVDVGTPFDFPEQALMYVPASNIPSPKDRQAWMSWSMMATLQMVQAAGGGALLLFTSRTAMEEAYGALADVLEMHGFTALMQGNRAEGRQFSNKQLAKAFKEDTHSVLFALKSFFVGVDVPGDACRLVVIDKLPFPVPTDPIFAARALAEEKAGRRSFNSLSVPMMTLVLEQGIGRLIRRVTDKGVVAVMDSRLTSTPYGRSIVHALPEIPVTTEMSQVKAFFAKHF